MNRNISLASRDPLPLGREDIYKGMEDIGTYLDVTPRDFQEIYAHAYKIARGRLLSSITAGDIMPFRGRLGKRRRPVRRRRGDGDGHAPDAHADAAGVRQRRGP